jgi:hypothetical protein
MAPETDNPAGPSGNPADHAAQAAHHAVHTARHAARRARFAARRATFRARCEGTPWFFGTLLIGLGLLFLLDNLDIIEARFVFRNMWPLLVLFFGLSRLMFGRGGERVFGAIATLFGGLWLGDRLFDWDVNVMGVFWPLILIGLGVSLLFRPRRAWTSSGMPPFPPVPPIPGTPASSAGFAEAGDAAAGAGTDDSYTDESARLREVAIMAGIERRNVSQTFRGGAITSVMGSVEIDLRDCRMAEASAIVTVQIIMGQVVLRLPPDWTVESRLSTVLGNLEDRSDRPVQSTPKRLIVEGSVFMGQVEIRN